MTRGQARVTETPTEEGIIVRLTDCFTGDILFEQEANRGGELMDTVYEAWTVARKNGLEVVQ